MAPGTERPQAFATLRAPEFDCAIRTGGGEHLPIWAKRDSSDLRGVASVSAYEFPAA